ncbi:MAG: HAD-IIB family hydrolase [Myxococcota bacterium]
MEHYVSLDPSKLRGVVFDIDDTVTRDGVLEAEAFSAMHRLRRAGLSLVSVTGRPLGWTDVVARMWPVDLAVGENGAGWAWVENGRSREGYFASEDERRQQRVMLDAVARAVAERMPHVELANDRGARRCDLAFDIGEEQTLPPDEIDLLVGIIEEHGASSLVSTVHAHATPGDWDKARGLEKAFRDVLSVELSAEADRWLFVGDSGNDAAAFSFFPVSAGVANVREHLDRLPTPPAYVTDSDRGLGFAELAHHVCRHRG